MKIHLYAQEAHHEDAFVVADAAGLTALRDVCEAALRKGASAIGVDAQDGEGYTLIAVNLETRDPKWEQLLLPYTLSDLNPEAYVESRISPFDVVGALRYRELHARLRSERPPDFRVTPVSDGLVERSGEHSPPRNGGS